MAIDTESTQAMPLLFVDEADTEGRITDDFNIEYDGPENVEEYIEKPLNEAGSREEVTEDIILDMVRDLRIQEVRRED